MEGNQFADIVGSFEVAEPIRNQLDATDSIQEAITEQQIRDMYWRLSFKRVQYGTFNGACACLIVVEARLHAERSKRHRFTWVRISVDFSGEQQGAVELQKLAPEQAHGVHVPQENMSRWALSAGVSLSIPGTPITVDIFNASRGHYEKYKTDLIATMQGTKRGLPKAKEATWTVDEAKQEGVPLMVPSMVMILTHPPGSAFVAKFTVQARTNASLRPSSWQPLQGPAQLVSFDGKAELYDVGETLSTDFAMLDLSKLTKLNFAEN